MIDYVCGSCRYYANKECHVDPPQAVLTSKGYEAWRRPHVETDDIACANFEVPRELARRADELARRRAPNPSETQRI